MTENMTTWREEKRSEMFKMVITAIDAAKGEALDLGDENFVRLCDEQLFPFLENELAIAELFEMMKEHDAADEE